MTVPWLARTLLARSTPCSSTRPARLQRRGRPGESESRPGAHGGKACERQAVAAVRRGQGGRRQECEGEQDEPRQARPPGTAGQPHRRRAQHGAADDADAGQQVVDAAIRPTTSR